MACRGLSQSQGHGKQQAHFSVEWIAGMGTCCRQPAACNAVILKMRNVACIQAMSQHWQATSWHSVTVLCMRTQWPKVLNAPLAEVDPELEDIIEHEKNRQWKVRPPCFMLLPFCTDTYALIGTTCMSQQLRLAAFSVREPVMIQGVWMPGEKFLFCWC